MIHSTKQNSSIIDELLSLAEGKQPYVLLTQRYPLENEREMSPGLMSHAAKCVSFYYNKQSMFSTSKLYNCQYIPCVSPQMLELGGSVLSSRALRLHMHSQHAASCTPTSSLPPTSQLNKSHESTSKVSS